MCKHWLRSLCKKGEACEFLHEYNLLVSFMVSALGPQANFATLGVKCRNATFLSVTVIAATVKSVSTSTLTLILRSLSVRIMKTASVPLARHVQRSMSENQYANSTLQVSAQMGGKVVKRVRIQDGLQGWRHLLSRSRGRRGRMVVTGMVGGVEKGMVGEMVVGIEGVIGSAVEEVGLVGGDTMAEEEGEIEIDRLCFHGGFFFGRLWALWAWALSFFLDVCSDLLRLGVFAFIIAEWGE